MQFHSFVLVGSREVFKIPPIWYRYCRFKDLAPGRNSLHYNNAGILSGPISADGPHSKSVTHFSLRAAIMISSIHNFNFYSPLKFRNTSPTLFSPRSVPVSHCFLGAAAVFSFVFPFFILKNTTAPGLRCLWRKCFRVLTRIEFIYSVFSVLIPPNTPQTADLCHCILKMQVPSFYLTHSPKHLDTGR